MFYKFCVSYVDVAHDRFFKHFFNYMDAVDYAFKCEDDPDILYVELKIIYKGDYLDNE